jgi:ribosomal protein S18 acetylase RimI-like enzyme
LRKCQYDGSVAHYCCARSGGYLCLSHARLQVVAPSPVAPSLEVAIRTAGTRDRETIRQFAEGFWGETDVDCFGKTYDLLSVPALLGFCQDQVAGVLAYLIEGDRLNILMLAVDPIHQGNRVAGRFLENVENVGVRAGVRRLVVATTNDDLPALYVYQRAGFTFAEIVREALLRHHGCALTGFAGIPIRDEIRLWKELHPDRSGQQPGEGCLSDEEAARSLQGWEVRGECEDVR